MMKILTNEKLVPQLRFSEFFEVWNKVLFADIAIFSRGKNISKSDIVENGEIKCIRYGELYTSYGEIINEVISQTDLSKDDLVFSRSNDIIIPSSGETQLDIATASCVLKDNIALGGDLNIIRTKNNGVFISYYLNNKKKKDIASLAQGNSVVHLYNHHLKSLQLNLPNLTEQQKIATFLSSVDKKLDQLQQKKSHLEQYKKGVMQQLFSQQLRFRDENGKDYSDWEEKRLGEIGRIITGKTPSTTNKKLWAGDIQFITPTDIDEEKKYQFETARTVTSTGKLNVLPLNSIMYTCIASIGKMALSVKPCITNQQINSLIPNEGLNNEFVYYSLQWMTPRIKSLQANTTLPIINKTDFSKIRILIPNLKEQTQIASFLSGIDQKIDLVNIQLETTQQFKKGLLQQLFV